MTMVLNGFTPKTAENLQLDAGILVINLDKPEEFDGTFPDGCIKIGATSGGGSFNATPEIRNIFEDLDGARGTYKDGNVIDNWDINLSVTMKEMSIDNLKMALGVGDSEVSENGKFDIITARNDIRDEDYIKNVCWLGTKNKSDLPMIIKLDNVLNTAGMSLSFQDKATGGVALTLVAHFDLENPDTVPFTIYSPVKTA